MSIVTRAPLTLLTPMLFACQAPLPVVPHTSDATLMLAPAAAASISGTWNMEREVFIHLSEFGALAFGFAPEGVRTTVRCTAEGMVMHLSQQGTTFEGSITTSAFTCATAGGQVISVPIDETVVSGEIRGRSLHFTLIGVPGPVECPAHGVVADEEGGVATELRGTWACIEPGHPQSAIAAPTPRAGPNRTHWLATRQP